MKVITLAIFLVAGQAMSMSLGFKNDDRVKSSVVVPPKGVSTTPVDCDKTDPVTVNNGDNVGTKVICNCEAKPCEPKTVIKTVVKKSPPKIIEKEIVKTVQLPPKIVEKEVVRTVTKEVTVVKHWTARALVGQGPYGVYFYRYGSEYRARQATGILVGGDLNYQFDNGLSIGGTYINNDTKMGAVGFSF